MRSYRGQLYGTYTDHFRRFKLERELLTIILLLYQVSDLVIAIAEAYMERESILQVRK